MDQLGSRAARDPATERFIAGDPLRGAAAIAIVVLHLAFAVLLFKGLPTDRFVDGFGRAGWLLKTGDIALYVFLCLSGYLISKPFVRSFILAQPMPDVRRYIRNRLLRIVPAFAFAFVVVLVLTGTSGDSPSQIASVFALNQNLHSGLSAQYIGQGWTVNTELHFYLIVPLAAVALIAAGRELGERARLVAVLTLCAAAAVASLAVSAVNADSITHIRSLPALLYAFVPGIALAAIEIPALVAMRGAARARLVAPGLLVVGAGLVMLHVAINPTAALFRENTPVVNAVLACLGTSALLAAALAWQWTTGGCPRILDNGPLRWVGERSYSLYLLHSIIAFELSFLIDWVDSPLRALAVTFLGSFPVMLLAAAASYRFVERPFLDRRVTWRRVPSSRPGQPLS